MRASTPLAAPIAKVVPKKITVHGDTRIDDYFWLRDRDDPDTIEYLVAENQYATEWMRPTEPLQVKLFEELLGRIKEDDSSVPVRVDDWFYYTRTEKDRGYTIYCRKHGSLDAAEEIYLDCNLLAAGRKYFRIGSIARSPDHDLLAYSTDHEGGEQYTIRIKDLRSGNLLPDSIENTYYTLEWANDNRSFFYTVLDETKRPYRVYRHELGGATDVLVYEEKDARFEVEIAKSRSREYIFLNIESPLTSEVRSMRSSDATAEFLPVLPREQGVEYDVEHQGEWFYIRTNDGAQNFRLMRAPVANPSKQNWDEVIAGHTDTTIESIDVFRDYLVVSERHKGLEQIRFALAGALENFQGISFPEPVYTVATVGNGQYTSHVLRFTYASLTTPPSVFDFDMESGQRELKKRQDVLGGYDPSLYQSERLSATAADGVEVPVSLVYRKGLQRNGTNPMLLYGYGAYGATADPGFDSARLSMLDRGFIFAIAHVRGGGDLGKFWHEQGRLLSKKNTFTDFISCADHLIAQRYTSPRHLAILGGSAGGLLMGAAVNLRPDLFRALISRVPFVDALNTMLDATLPLTITEFEEWGNPENPQVYRYLRSYSPYDNVQAKPYPAMLVKCGLNDPRVSYWEPAKWVAKLRATKTDDHVLLLKTNMGAGHFGPSGRYSTLRELAFDYAFLLSQLSPSTNL